MMNKYLKSLNAIKDTLFFAIGLIVLAMIINSDHVIAETSSERQAKIVVIYNCQDGSSFRARFDNTGNYSIAILDLGEAFEIPLIETISGSGEKYTNEDYALHTKNDDAVLTRYGKDTNCSTE